MHSSSSNTLLLIGLATVMFLLGALGLFLLSTPAAPAFQAETPTAPARLTIIPAATVTPEPPTVTPHTSYTPFATRLTVDAGTQAAPSGTTTPPTGTLPPTQTSTPAGPAGTQPASLTPTITRTLSAGTASPTATSQYTAAPTTTLTQGEIGIRGRVVQNGTPLSGVLVTYRDDQPTRSAVTDTQGYYWFTSNAMGVYFILTFEQSANPHLAASSQVASVGLLTGYLPVGSTMIGLPDLEISLVLEGQSFNLTSPLDGAIFSASVISANNPIQLTWSAYLALEYYFVELYEATTDDMVWGSENTSATNTMFDGTLDDDTHIEAGTYYWMVAADRPIGAYTLTVYTQPSDLVINP